MNSFTAIICGLKSEADAIRSCVGAAAIRIGISGADAKRAEEITKAFCGEGASAIVSAGLSGGLDPVLKPGRLIVGSSVIDRHGANGECDIYLMRAVREVAKKRNAAFGAIFGADDVIASADEKASLYTQFNCIAVDMESHGAARSAAAAGIPFIAIRAIADPADRAMPPAALGAVAPDGSTRVAATLGAAIRRPRQLPALIKLGSDSSAALKTLRRDIGPLLTAISRAIR